MADAAFSNNTTCQAQSQSPSQKPDRSKPPSAHTNTSNTASARSGLGSSSNPHSQQTPLNPLFKRSRSPSISHSKHSPRQHQPRPRFKTPSDPEYFCTTPIADSSTLSQILKDNLDDSMLSTPLPDYKHAANQTNKAKAAAQAAAATRKSSSTSGNSGERKNVVQAMERAAAARADNPGRSSSISSATGSSGLTAVTSSDPPGTDELFLRPFTRRNGRRYLRDTTLPYPLPCDLAEIHRQTLRTMLLCQVFNGPICSPAFQKKPPKRVLEVGCGTGFWSVMCHRHFSQRGCSSISFTGIDIAPLAPRMESDDDMNWRFVQHDLRRLPLPFRDDEFNLIMIKDMSMATPAGPAQQSLMDEYLRILKPGGTLEIWDGDHSLRMLLQHAPPSTRGDSDESEDEEQLHTNAMGTYTLTPQTPFAAPQNQYLSDYNAWVRKALEARNLTPMPCTIAQSTLLQESEVLTEFDSRRLAIPLGEVRWEREGVGDATTKDSNGHSSSNKGKGKEMDRRALTAGQAALRRTALMTVVQMIESLEPLLREASGKLQDEWDRWQGNMMTDLLKQGGTSWGECLEVGAWWARKRKN